MTDHEEQSSREVPEFYASGANIAATGTDIKLVFTDNRPVCNEDGEIIDKRKMIVCGVITLSFHSAKDLHRLLDLALQQLEKNIGTIDTPFLQSSQERSKQ